MKGTAAVARRVSAILLAVASTTSCSVSEQPVPEPTGPSTSAFLLTMTPLAERLPRDGTTQTIVTLSARDQISSTVLSGQRVALSSVPFEATLSSSEITTGADGRATFTVTAPPASAVDSAIVVFATPIGGYSEQLPPRQLTIPLIDTSGIVARFTVTPAQPGVGQTVTFDASGSTVEPGAVITSYTWSFGDGIAQTTTQPTINHTYSDSRIYAVILTITDSRNRSQSTAKNITVGP